VVQRRTANAVVRYADDESAAHPACPRCPRNAPGHVSRRWSWPRRSRGTPGPRPVRAAARRVFERHRVRPGDGASLVRVDSTEVEPGPRWEPGRPATCLPSHGSCGQRRGAAGLARPSRPAVGRRRASG
jgi:hypothetical protein